MKLTPKDASKITGKTYAFIIGGLRQNSCPFGYGVLMDGGQWSYHISEHLLRQYVGDGKVDEYVKEIEA